MEFRPTEEQMVNGEHRKVWGSRIIERKEKKKGKRT